MLRQRGGAASEVVVVRAGTDEENIRQPLLGDEALEVAEIGFADARGAAANHVETGELPRLMLLVDVEELADADRQRQAFAARGVLETALELVRSSGSTAPGCRPRQRAAIAKAWA